MITRKEYKLLAKISNSYLTSSLAYWMNREEKGELIEVIKKIDKEIVRQLISMDELALSYGVCIRKFKRDMYNKKALVKKLQDNGWKPRRNGFYPQEVELIREYFG